MYLIGPAAASFSLCLLAMLALRPLAIAVNLIDRPGGRKLHDGDVPVVGGLGMLLGIILGLGLLPLPDWTTGTLLAACAILVTVGLIDDRFGLSPWLRLPAQIAAAVILVLGSQAVITTLGEPFGMPMQLEGMTSYVITVVCIIAAINAFNMLDGMDGLAGALAIVALVALAILAGQSGNTVILSISVVIIGAITAFLISNLPVKANRRVRCFMGDSGSTLLGLALAWLCINASQDPAPVARPVTMLWIVAIPLYDLCWTVIRRSIQGIPPFRSDQGHLHHMVLRAGIGVQGAFMLMFVIAVFLASIGVTLDRAGTSDSWSLALFFAAGVFIVWLLCSPKVLRTLIPRAFQNARPAVSN